MIVIDGPDHVGKTRLAEVLVERLNAEGFPHVYQHLSRLPASFHHVTDYKPLIQRNVVMDRFHLSRIAYGTVFAEQHVPNDYETAILDAWITLVGGLTIVVTADGDWLRANFGAKDEMYALRPVLEVNRVYKKLIEEKRVNIDFTWETRDCATRVSVFPAQHESFIIGVIEEYKRRRAVLEATLGQVNTTPAG